MLFWDRQLVVRQRHREQGRIGMGYDWFGDDSDEALGTNRYLARRVLQSLERYRQEVAVARRSKEQQDVLLPPASSLIEEAVDDTSVPTPPTWSPVAGPDVPTVVVEVSESPAHDSCISPLSRARPLSPPASDDVVVVTGSSSAREARLERLRQNLRHWVGPELTSQVDKLRLAIRTKISEQRKKRAPWR